MLKPNSEAEFHFIADISLVINKKWFSFLYLEFH